MEEISVVKKRSRLWPILLAILLVVAIVLIALWLMGSNTTTTDIGVNGLFELGGRSVHGTA